MGLFAKKNNEREHVGVFLDDTWYFLDSGLIPYHLLFVTDNQNEKEKKNECHDGLCLRGTWASSKGGLISNIHL
jgi:hypothetical protein